MQILDKYFLREFLKILFGTLILLTGIGIISKIMETLQLVLKYKGSSTLIWQYYLYNIPNIFSMVLTPALMFAISFTVAKFSNSFELMVIYSAGRSFKRIMRPIILFTFLFSVFLLFFNEYLAFPLNYQAFNKLNIMRGRTVENYRNNIITNVNYRAQNRYYQLGYFNPIDHRPIQNLHVVELQNNSNNIKRIIEAESAIVVPHKWELFKANISLFNTSGHFIEKKYSEKTTINLPESIIYFMEPEKNLEEMTIFDLPTFIDRAKKRGESPLVYQVELAWHYSFPFVSFFVVLVGGIIGSQMKKGAMASSIGLSILVTLIYFIIMYFGKSLGNTGILPPYLAGWLANIFFTIISLFLIIKYNK